MTQQPKSKEQILEDALGSYNYHELSSVRVNILVAMEAYSEQHERFKMPTDQQIIKMAIIFNDGYLDPNELTNMVSMCQFIIDRLYENGDIMIKSSKEEK